MKISSIIVILSVTLAFPFITRSQPQPAILRSPDGQLSILFEVVASSNAPASDTGRLVYSVSFHDKRVLERSGLRLDLEGQEPLGTNVQIVATTNGSNDSSYQLVTGKTREA